MSEVTIEKIDETLEICEQVKRDTPEYYKQHWKEKHELLLKIKAEKENKS